MQMIMTRGPRLSAASDGEVNSATVNFDLPGLTVTLAWLALASPQPFPEPEIRGA
jgi:hypothetical protein